MNFALFLILLIALIIILISIILYNGLKIELFSRKEKSNFEIEFSDNNYIFTVYGYGHGVGMSQNGANYMAKQGSNFKEILTHYYTGCKIEKIKAG